MSSLLLGSLVCLLLMSAPASAGQGDNPASKQAVAVRVTADAIRVDGRLDEEIWNAIVPIADFVQKEPSEGDAPAERTEVRFAYDDSGLYVGARMFSRDPSTIQAPMGRRDNIEREAEHLLISLDTFLDRRTAYTFGVTASGVRLDRFHPTDDEATFDAGFDPVWEARTHVDDRGWTAELWIPFTQLRYTDRPEQVWGLNVRRFTPTLEEEAYWVLVPRTVQAWASRFGELRGIDGVRPTRRLELLPFVAGSIRSDGDRDAADPFDGRDLASRAGVDLKMGLGPSLTLEATANPDFGQVEADPAEVNLTAFETRFTEKRPFFIEGSQLLHPMLNNAFYSRRIGARPSGPAPGDFVDYPSDSTIVAATKLTGRLPSGTSLGILSAFTAGESARVAVAPEIVAGDFSRVSISRVRVAPPATYGVARVLQEFGRSGSIASAFVTGVHRHMEAEDPLAAFLSRTGFVFGGDARVRLKGGEYELTTAAVGTYVGGERAAIERIQRSSAHYAQRPDKRYGRLDPSRTALPGFSMMANIERLSGRHWLWGVRTKYESVWFETNDIGVLNSAEGIEPTFILRYRETRPGRIFRNYSIGITQINEWNRAGDRQRGFVEPSATLTWRNFWTTTVTGSWALRGRSTTLTRGGPLMAQPRGWSVNATAANSVTAPTRWLGSATVGGNEEGGITRRINGSLSLRPGPRWQVSLQPFYERLVETQQYVTTLAGGGPETFGRRYVFAFIDRNTYSAQLRLGFSFKPDVNLDVYAEPFAASGRYYDFGALGRAGGRRRDPIEIVNDNDFNVRSFRSNTVLRWEWRPGSTLYVVWQQDRQAREAIGTRVGVGDLFGSIGEPGSNIVLIKTSFWLPVQ